MYVIVNICPVNTVFDAIYPMNVIHFVIKKYSLIGDII